jgi:hypothetical protein
MDFIHLYYLVNIMKKEKRYGTVGTMPKSNSKETESIHNAQFPGLLQALRVAGLISFMGPKPLL